MRTDPKTDSPVLAEAVRDACVEAALQAYEDAGLSGLCEEGRWECAVEAMRGLDGAQVLEQAGAARRAAEMGHPGSRVPEPSV